MLSIFYQCGYGWSHLNAWAQTMFPVAKRKFVMGSGEDCFLSTVGVLPPSG
jgi:hypothetical protein